MYKPKIIYTEIIPPVDQQKQRDMAFFYQNRQPNKKLFLIYVLSYHTTKTTKEWHLNVYSAPNENIMQNPNKKNYPQPNKFGGAIFTFNEEIDKNHWWLTSMLVKDDFQGRKIGSHLLNLADMLAQEKKIPDWKIACLESHDSILGYPLSSEGEALITSYIFRHPTFSRHVILPKDQMKNDGLPEKEQTEFIPQTIVDENTDENDTNSLGEIILRNHPAPKLLATIYNALGVLLSRENKLHAAFVRFKAAANKTDIHYRSYGIIYTNICRTLSLSKQQHKAENFKKKIITRLENKLKRSNNIDTQNWINSHLECIKAYKPLKRKRESPANNQNAFYQPTLPEKKKRKLPPTTSNNLPQQKSHVMMQRYV